MIVFLIKGGWALWVITASSIVALGVTLERWRTLRRANVDSEALLDKLSKALDRDDIGECWPAGVPIIMTRVWPIAMIQLPTAVYMVSEFMNRG